MQKDKTVDVALLLFNTMAHLHCNGDAKDCFNCSFEALNPGGLLILELPPTKDIFDGSFVEGEYWEEPIKNQDGLQLITEYGTDDDEFDHESQASLFQIIILLGKAPHFAGVPKPRKAKAKKVL